MLLLQQAAGAVAVGVDGSGLMTVGRRIEHRLQFVLLAQRTPTSVGEILKQALYSKVEKAQLTLKG